MSSPHSLSLFFFFNDTATTEIYTLSLHDALPISRQRRPWLAAQMQGHQGRAREQAAQVGHVASALATEKMLQHFIGDPGWQQDQGGRSDGRSEERRGGEERRSRWAPDHLKKKKKKSRCRR